MQTVFCVILLLGIFAAWVTVRLKHLPGDETSIFIILVIATLVGISLGSAHGALVILYSSFALPSQRAAAIYACLFFVPVLAFGFAFLGGRTRYRRLLSLATTDVEQIPEGRFIHNTTQDLCKQMKVTSRVNLLCLKAPGFSPVAFAVSKSQSVVLLPRNLWDLARLACAGDRSLMQHLVRLVLAHEIAHVVNGDVRYVPFLALASALLSSCFLVIAVLCWLISHVSINETTAILQPRLMSVLISGFVFLALLIRFIIAKRERMADRTAREYLPPQWIERLTGERSDTVQEPCPLESFVVLVRPINPCSRSVMGFALCTPTDKLLNWVGRHIGWDSVAAFRDRLRSRIHSLRLSATHKDMEHSSRVWNMIATAVFGVFLFVIFEAVTLQDFEFFWLKQHPRAQQHLQTSFLHAIDGWSQLQKQDAVAKLNRSLGPFAIALAMTGIFSWTVRRLRAAEPQNVSRGLLRITGWSLFICFCFLSLRLLWEVEAIPSVVDFRFLRPDPLAVCGWFILLTFGHIFWQMWISPKKNDA